MHQEERSGWSTNWEDFFASTKAQFLDQLITFYYVLEWTTELSESQRYAWDIEYTVIKNTLIKVCEQTKLNPKLCWISFEQELVGEGGKRAADVNLVLPSGELFVIEFKHKAQASAHEITRANFDLQTMLKFHSESATLRGHCYLALTKLGAQAFEHETVICDIAADDCLPKLLHALIESSQLPNRYDVSQWQHGSFYRQPSILHGTVQVFFDEKIPTLKTQAAENIAKAKDNLLTLYRHAQDTNQRYVVVVNGRPGAGKTLLGISVVAELVKQYGAEHCQPVFLSGNRPLVQVLQHTLEYHGRRVNKTAKIDGRALIQELLNFKREIKRNRSDRAENFVVFDEAQRAWEKVNSRDPNSPSELALLCQWLSEKEYGVLVLLVGDGQAIHNNEMSLENMLVDLERALLAYQARITPIMPALHQAHFKQLKPIHKNVFYLPTPIRQAYTENLDSWIEAVLSGDSSQAASLAAELYHCYPLLVTQNRQAAESHAKALQAALHEGNKLNDAFRVGWLMSSKGGKFIPEISNGSNLVGPWYVDAPTSANSCCQFNNACTEFTCQGLELSIALFNWGQDLLCRNGNLTLSNARAFMRNQAHYTEGSYRVLLSRGRNGLIIRCVDDETHAYLKACGMKEIEKVE